MEPVQNTSLNQSYYDPADDVCSAAPTASSGGVGTTTSAGGQSSGVIPEPTPWGTAPLVDAYYQGQGGTAPAPSDAAGAPVTTDDSTGGTATLCDRRLAANRLICGIGGSLIAERFGMGGLKGASAAYAISDGCVSIADWLEHNAPLGACEE